MTALLTDLYVVHNEVVAKSDESIPMPNILHALQIILCTTLNTLCTPKYSLFPDHFTKFAGLHRIFRGVLSIFLGGL